MSEHPIVGALREALGEAAVTAVGRFDSDSRTRDPVSGRSFGTPIAWVRPATTTACAHVFRIAREHDVPVSIVGEATTFWDGLRVDGAVALDTHALAGSLAIDVDRRLAWASASCSIRDVDRAARAHGLAIASYPDASGETSIGSLVSVGCTSGLGMGRCLPIDQLMGATVVTASGEVLRLGASHALGQAAFARHGAPDALGLFVAGEGAAGILTEVGLSLVPAGFVVTGRASRKSEGVPEELIARAMTVARSALDRGTLDTFRIEVASRGAHAEAALDVFFRSLSLRSAADAAEEARRFASDLREEIGASISLTPETADARRGVGPGYDERYSIPPGEHRYRLGGGAFWGSEVAVGWGPELRACLARLATLFRQLADTHPLHRRFGAYAGHHSSSLGVQVVGRRDAAAVEALRAALIDALPDLLDRGGVPYRPGNLWSTALAARVDSLADGDVIDRLRRVLDPAATLPGARGRSPR